MTALAFVDESQRVKLKFRQTSRLLLVVYCVASCGLALVLFGLERLFHDPIEEVDELGVVTRKGRRFAWANLRSAGTKAEFARNARPSSMPVVWRVNFEFEGAKLAFVPQSYENGFEVLALIEKALGRSFDRPKPRAETDPRHL